MKTYADLKTINVNTQVERKGKFNYLSWAWAVDQLLVNDPTATWEYKDPTYFAETLMVYCSVTAFGKTMTAQLPVMNNQNKAIQNPDAFAVNTAMQRCLAKAIALHGIGLYIYAGEDLPEEVEIEIVELEDLIKKLNEANTLDELKNAYVKAVKSAGNSKSALTALEQTKDSRKKELSAV